MGQAVTDSFDMVLMTLKLNEAFRTNILGFIRQNVMATVGFSKLPGVTLTEFDWRAHVVNSNNAVNTTVARLA